MIFHPCPGAMQARHQLLALRVEGGLLVALAGALYLDQRHREAASQQHLQFDGRRLQRLGTDGEAPRLVAQLAPAVARLELNGVGEQRALIVEGTAHPAEDELLAGRTRLGGQTTDVVVFGVTVVIA